MRERAALCEHPFGTLKRWLGWDHFLVRGFEKVRGEMALLVHCYNFRRLLSILSVQGFIDGCRQRCRERQAGNQGGGLFARPCLPLWRSLRPCPAFWRALRFLRTRGFILAAPPTALAPAG